jgi:hypothetical protein
MGIPAKALIFKALARLKTRYQQSYPQKTWKQYKVHINQALSLYFARKLQLPPSS